MPYKIVQTIENGQIKLTAVPEQWENEGILLYPSKKIEKFRKNEDSIPKEGWVSMNCIVKRVNLTFRDSEIELKKMCSTSDTETDLDDNSSRKRMKANLEDTSYGNNFYQIAEECLNNDVPNSNANVERELVYITQDANAVQFSIPEVPQPRNTLNSESNSNDLESKIEVLTENVKLLSENIIIVQKNQQELFKAQEQILHSLANIHTQFEQFIEKAHQPEVKEKNDIGFTFKRISDQESFDQFEKMLEDVNVARNLLNGMAAVCGTHRGKGINNAYALIDVMFDRAFLQQCSWAGGSRTDSQKICFKIRNNTLKFFFKVINQADNNFTFIDTQQFFKVILRNSRQRCESTQQRKSVSKAKRPKKSDTADAEPSIQVSEQQLVSTDQMSEQLPEVQLIVVPGSSNTESLLVSQQNPESFVNAEQIF